ncbi:MAG: metalloregulator ArsR/SmtB family transcription factor [Acidobacteriota bacterium]
MPNSQAAQLTAVFRGLADPTRRAVIARLSRGPASVTSLAQPFAMALPSFIQHLDVLEDCGLVKSKKVGRVRTYRLVPAPLTRAGAWLAQQRMFWNRRLDQLDAHLITIKESGE